MHGIDLPGYLFLGKNVRLPFDMALQCFKKEVVDASK